LKNTISITRRIADNIVINRRVIINKLITLNMMSTASANKHKPKRIDKELLLLRNLPKEYKLGKREIPLGTLLYVRI